MTDSDIARAIAYFETTEDVETLQKLLQLVKPRAAAEVRRYQQRRQEVPPPRVIQPAPAPATAEEAARIARSPMEFDQLMALSRAAGKRLEVLSSGQAGSTG